jgi:hypothetical protein
MPENKDVKGALEAVRRIAVLGLSPKEERISNAIARFLVNSGREIVPINPGHPEILGQTSYPDLKSVPDAVDMAVVFRAPKFTAEVLEDAKTSGVNRVWFQPGAFDGSFAGSEYVDGMDLFYGD